MVACTMGFMRPSELPLNYLWGVWSHFFIGDRARLCGVTRPYIGFLFGKPEEDKDGTVVTTGGQTKVTRSNQRLDCDKRGSDLVIFGRAQGSVPHRHTGTARRGFVLHRVACQCWQGPSAVPQRGWFVKIFQHRSQPDLTSRARGAGLS